MLRNGAIKALNALFVVSLLSLLSLVGCGTLIARTPNAHTSYDYYKGTQANIELLTMRGAVSYTHLTLPTILLV